MTIMRERPRLIEIDADILDRVDQIGSLYGLSKTELINMWLTTKVVQFYSEGEDIGASANEYIEGE